MIKLDNQIKWSKACLIKGFLDKCSTLWWEKKEKSVEMKVLISSDLKNAQHKKMCLVIFVKVATTFKALNFLLSEWATTAEKMGKGFSLGLSSV